MITVSGILKNKGNDIFSVTPASSVYDAIKLMSEKNVGALPVIDEQGLCGIFSERDYARKIVLLNRKSQETSISEIMTAKVITVNASDSLDKCMELMSVKKIRHLPVLESGKLIGIISIGDVVTAIIQSQQETISHLQNYITQ
ncbi:MAG: CBS domain-containing protein [Pedobacter sp.]|nr:MAG: CBS domain-containing protein [Pedobacter sp.]